MLKKFLLYSILIILYVLTATPQNYAQQTGALRGLVTDSTTSEPLAFGNVYIKEISKGASTDGRGYYYIPSIPANRNYTLIVSYVGYKTKEIRVYITNDKITDQKVELIPSVISLSEVEKTGEKFIQDNPSDISMDRIFVRELETLPKGVETDIFRSLKLLPGVKSTGDVSARYYVRGGSSNQNLVLLENTPIYSPFHALGMFSVIDPDMVNYVEFQKGGFNAEYGGRISSLLKVSTKDGNKNRFAGVASASFLSAKGLVEGPIPNGSFLVTGRKSHSNKILNKFLNDKNVPIDFYDISFKLNYSDPEFMQDAKFTAHGFFSKDILDNPDPTKEDYRWDNNLIGAHYFQWITNSPMFYEFGVSYSNFNGWITPNESNSQEKRNIIIDLTLKGDITYIFNSKDQINGGVKFMLVESDLYLENVRGSITDIQTKGVNISLYGNYKFLQFEKFGADVGSRVNLTRLAAGTAGEISFEPRVNVNYKVLPEVTLNASWGIYEQELTTISDENEIITIFEPWVFTPYYLKPARATQYIAGIETKFWDPLKIKVEGYYKDIKNLTAINEQKYFPEDNDLISGSGEAYGMEVSSELSLDPVLFKAGYSLSWAFKEINGVRYHPRYDSRHSVGLSMSVNIGSGWSASAQWNYNSGLPFTQLVGFYNKLYFQDLGDRDVYFDPYTILAGRNLGRLPDYHRLDLSLSKKFTFNSFNLIFDVSVLNVYNRNNLFYFDRDTGERVNMLPFLPTATVRAEL